MDSERSHFLEVCYSFLDYFRDCQHDVQSLSARRSRVADPLDLALWPMDEKSWTASISSRIKENADFLRLLPAPEVCCAPIEPPEMALSIPPGHRVESRNSSKVRSTLRQFVRDWAAEGAPEREMCYGPLIEALQRNLPAGARGSQRVLCPGSGLGRLPFDLARLGYAAQGNEFSYHMIMGSQLVFNRTNKPLCFTIYPFVTSIANRRRAEDTLQAVRVPDVCPVDALPEGSDFSMAGGEFVAVYEKQLKEWDGVATSFFLDTAKNVFLYIRTIADLLRRGGVWTNLGPLLYHYADVDHETSIELSWEEVRPFVLRFFDIVEEEFRVSTYTVSPASMMRTRFRCVFFTAVRNGKPVSGASNPVF